MKKNTLADIVLNHEENLELPLFYHLTEMEQKAKKFFTKNVRKVNCKKSNSKIFAIRFYKPISKFP